MFMFHSQNWQELPKPLRVQASRELPIEFWAHRNQSSACTLYVSQWSLHGTIRGCLFDLKVDSGWPLCESLIAVRCAEKKRTWRRASIFGKPTPQLLTPPSQSPRSSLSQSALTTGSSAGLHDIQKHSLIHSDLSMESRLNIDDQASSDISELMATFIRKRWV